MTSMTEIRTLAKTLGCPECGGSKVEIDEQLECHCQDCGWAGTEPPETYLTGGEVIDFKCGMWAPTKHPRTSLMLEWKVNRKHLTLETGAVDFDLEDGTLKEWLLQKLISDGELDGRTITFWLRDDNMGDQ